MLSLVGGLLLLAGAAIWTVMIHKVESINGFIVHSGSTATPLGIEVSVGSQLFLVWAAFACLLGSTIPYMIM
jgi:hypothetical protein